MFSNSSLHSSSKASHSSGPPTKATGSRRVGALAPASGEGECEGAGEGACVGEGEGEGEGAGEGAGVAASSPRRARRSSIWVSPASICATPPDLLPHKTRR